MTTRCRFTAESKAKAALEALRGDLTIQANGAKHNVHPNQVRIWKRRAVKGLGTVFSKDVGRARRNHESELGDFHVRIGELTVEWHCTRSSTSWAEVVA